MVSPIIMRWWRKQKPQEKDIYNTKIVLTHSGGIYCRETSVLISCYPNLYCDLAGFGTVFGTSIKKQLLKLLEMGLINKILFATDGLSIPETYWIGTKITMEGIIDALLELKSAGWIGKNVIFNYAEKILNKNTSILYKL